MANFVAISKPDGPKLVDQGWIKSGHIRGDVLEPFPGSGMAIGGHHKKSNGLKKPYNAFLWP